MRPALLAAFGEQQLLVGPGIVDLLDVIEAVLAVPVEAVEVGVEVLVGADDATGAVVLDRSGGGTHVRISFDAARLEELAEHEQGQSDEPADVPPIEED